MTCPKCGEVLPENAITCNFCGEVIQPAPKPTYENPVEEKPENVVGGAIGSLIGALIGGIAIVLIGQLGYVASVCGLIMAICALKGYELLGGKLSTKGIVISILFMLVVPVISYFAGAALSLTNELKDYGVTFSESLDLLLDYVQNDSETQSAVLKDLLMIYGFTALGAVGTVKNAFKKKK